MQFLGELLHGPFVAHDDRLTGQRGEKDRGVSATSSTCSGICSSTS
jgi:hypothetical protein